MMFANILIGLVLAAVPADTPAGAATAIDEFMHRLDSIAIVSHQARAEQIRGSYRQLLAPIDPASVADAEMEDLLLASLTASGLANDRGIAEHSRAIFDEMARRSLLDERLHADMQQLYVNLRDFDAARAFHDAFGERHVLDPLPAISSAPGFDPAQRSILVPDGSGGLQRRNFDAPQGDFVLVVTDPLCHYTRDAVIAIHADPGLRDYFAQHSRWLAAYGVRLDPGPVATWNTAFPEAPLVWVNDIRTWPEIDYWGTPTFYVFVGDKLAQTIRGWPKGGRVAELKQALGITRTGR